MTVGQECQDLLDWVEQSDVSCNLSGRQVGGKRLQKSLANQVVILPQKEKVTQNLGGFTQLRTSFKLFDLGEPRRIRTFTLLIKSLLDGVSYSPFAFGSVFLYVICKS
jgi:hypothetical protein